MKLYLAKTTGALCAVALLFGLTVACASSKKEADPIADLRTAIDEDVADKARAAKLSSAVDEMERVLREAVTFAARQREALEPMLQDYATPREAIESKLAGLNVERTALTGRMLDAHLAFKAAATEAEWKKLRKLEEAALVYALAESIEQKPLVGQEG